MGKRKLTALISLISIVSLVLAPSVKALEIEITENGSGSSSEVEVTQETQTTVEQTNEGSVDNNVDTKANTGDNEASGNTGGDTSVETGDASSETHVENELNSSSAEVGCCQGETEVSVKGNGEGSTNTVNLNQSSQTDVNVNQSASITNNINGTTSTGGNKANGNTGGSVTIETGDAKAGGSLENTANSSVVSASAGNSGASIVIAGNGEGSENDVKATFENDVEVYKNFSADIQNYVVWDVNTGRNEASGNTGGDVEITTGDASFEFFISNLANIGGVEIDCCEVFDPGDPGDGGDPDEPEDPGDPRDGGDDDKEDKEDENGDDEEDGKLLPSAAATEAGGPGIAGLSDTSSETANTIFFWAGLLMVGFGIKFVGESLEKKNLAKVPHNTG